MSPWACDGLLNGKRSFAGTSGVFRLHPPAPSFYEFYPLFVLKVSKVRAGIFHDKGY